MFSYFCAASEIRYNEALARKYTLSEAAIEQRRNAGVARQNALGEDGRTEYARSVANARWASRTTKKRKRRVVTIPNLA